MQGSYSGLGVGLRNATSGNVVSATRVVICQIKIWAAKKGQLEEAKPVSTDELR